MRINLEDMNDLVRCPFLADQITYPFGNAIISTLQAISTQVAEKEMLGWKNIIRIIDRQDIINPSTTEHLLIFFNSWFKNHKDITRYDLLSIFEYGHLMWDCYISSKIPMLRISIDEPFTFTLVQPYTPIHPKHGMLVKGLAVLLEQGLSNSTDFNIEVLQYGPEGGYYEYTVRRRDLPSIQDMTKDLRYVADLAKQNPKYRVISNMCSACSIIDQCKEK